MKKYLHILYITVFLGICLFPLLGMLLPAPQTAANENRRLAQAPALVDESGWNESFLQDAGAWYEDHFGLRSSLVSAWGRINEALFRVSASDRVITGTDGWLYYADSLADFQHTNPLSDREIFAVAHTLAMMEQNLSLLGIRFVFAAAPNKNTLYPEHMPYYTRADTGAQGNLARLEKALDEETVTYVSLKQVLENAAPDYPVEDGLLYHRRDSHWNNVGAMISAGALLDRIGKEHAGWESWPVTETGDFVGDLDGMLCPADPSPEKEYCFAGITNVLGGAAAEEREPSYRYVTQTESNFDPMISTACDTAAGSVAVFRDSFGNALLPFLASSFGAGYFTRGVPYQIQDVYEHAADTVMVIRAERFIPEMLGAPPVMEALPVFDETLLAGLQEASALKAVASENRGKETACFTVEENGYLSKVSGSVDPALLEAKTRIFLLADDGLYYEAFPASAQGDEDHLCNAFTLCLPAGKIAPAAREATILLV